MENKPTTTSLATVNNSIIASNNDLAKAMQILRTNTNCLIPESMTFGIRPELKITLTMVKIDTNLPEYKGKKATSNSDIYSVDANGYQYAIHKNKMVEIAQAGGMVITHMETVSRNEDENGLPVLINVSVGFKRLMIDGTTIEGSELGTFDYFRDKDKLDKTDRETGKLNETQSKSRRQFAHALAQSHAVLRAIKQCFPEIKGTYTLKELEKPFSIYRVIEDPSALINTLPEGVRDRVFEQYVQKKLGILGDIYPQKNYSIGATEQVVNPTNPIINKDNEIVVKPQPQEERPPMAEEVTYTSVEDNNGGITVEDQIKVEAKEFEQSTQQERTNVILALAEKVKYVTANGEKITKEMIEKSNLAKQIRTIEHLRLIEYKQSLQNDDEAPL